MRRASFHNICTAAVSRIVLNRMRPSRRLPHGICPRLVHLGGRSDTYHERASDHAQDRRREGQQQAVRARAAPTRPGGHVGVPPGPYRVGRRYEGASARRRPARYVTKRRNLGLLEHPDLARRIGAHKDATRLVEGHADGAEAVARAAVQVGVGEDVLSTFGALRRLGRLTVGEGDDGQCVTGWLVTVPWR